ncbi:MAG TPA: hypothetical protein VEQ37_11145 [Actinomycetota bacterium]|nr:hypothetical protein [Actinomycetota bacterium]
MGFVVLALRPDSAGQRTSGAQSSPTGAVGGGRANGLLAFGCGYRICTMAPDGTSVRDVMDGYDKSLVVAGYAPAWSPDGARIAFMGYDQEGSSPGGGANYDVYVMNADGSDLRNLTKTPTTSPAEPRRGRRSGRRTARCSRSRATTARPTGCTS